MAQAPCSAFEHRAKSFIQGETGPSRASASNEPRMPSGDLVASVAHRIAGFDRGWGVLLGVGGRDLRDDGGGVRGSH
jgi:hypothetical protein